MTRKDRTALTAVRIHKPRTRPACMRSRERFDNRGSDRNSTRAVHSSPDSRDRSLNERGTLLRLN
jgi:hypothetical protein